MNKSNKYYLCKQPASQLCFVEEIGQELKDMTIHEQFI